MIDNTKQLRHVMQALEVALDRLYKTNHFDLQRDLELLIEKIDFYLRRNETKEK